MAARKRSTSNPSRRRKRSWRDVKVIVEKHADGFVAYPLGLKGVVVGQGDTYEAALADVNSAVAFHIATFGAQVLSGPERTIDAYIAETRVAV